MNRDRTILHVDMDAFYAAVELLDRPDLRGKPLLVGGRDGRGVVCAASYEARAFGCRSAMPMSQALRLCPHAAVLPVRFERYREVSRRVHAVFERFTPAIEPLSIDEAFLDLTGSRRLLGDPADVAARIQREVLSETGCTCSVGVSYCKFLAKIASDLEKPRGLVIFGRQRLPLLPVTRIWGVGPKAAAKLAGYAIHTIGDLRSADPAFLAARFGSDTQRLIDLAWGRDDRPVVTDRASKSIGHENTYFDPLHNPGAVEAELLAGVEQVAFRLRRSGRAARGVTVKIRTTDFRTVTRSVTLDAATDVTGELWRAARQAFAAWASQRFAPVRLIGVQVKSLSPATDATATLFPLSPAPDHERQSRLDTTTDKIRQRFGANAIRRLGP